MSNLIASDYSTDGLAAYRNYLLVKLGMLSEWVSEQDRGPDVQKTLSVLDPILELTGAEIVAQGTPFFWKNVHRCYYKDQDERTQQRAARHLVLMAFDSFADRLPLGTSFRVPAVDGCAVILPRLGIYLDAPGEVTLTCVAKGVVRIASGSGTHEAVLGSGDSLTIPSRPVAGGGTLLLAYDETLFDQRVPGQMADLAVSTGAADSLAKSISEALAKIEEVAPAFHAELTSVVRWYFPITTPNPGAIHNSFSSKHLAGVIYLSDAYEVVRLVEAIVHEYHHNELYMMMETEAYFDIDAEALFYSPWRDDARPLWGLFHAVYVFSGVLEFYTRAEREHGWPCRERRQSVCYQLRTGLAQIPENVLAGPGREFIGVLRENLRRQADELGTSSSSLPEKQARHLALWREHHPKLASHVRTW